MARCWEINARRQFEDGENPSAETVWAAVEATSYADARSALDGAIPTTFTFPSGTQTFLDRIRANEIGSDDSHYEFTVFYVGNPQKETDEEEFEFEISAPTDAIWQSISTASYAAAGYTATDHKGRVGVDGRPFQVPQPFSTFRITKHFATDEVDQALEVAIEQAVGKTNLGLFRGRQIGEVRFLGARGRRSRSKFPISYEFGIRPNGTPFDWNGITISTAPKGWEIIEPEYHFLTDATAKAIARRARAVYVHQVFETSNFSGLRLDL